jgi:hypothetical protein
VTVSFNKRNERIKVPFTALSAFVDPSVRFGLQFEDAKSEGGAERGSQTGANHAIPGPGARAPGAGKSAGGKLLGSSRETAPARETPGERKDAKPTEAATDSGHAPAEAKGDGKPEGKGDGANKVVTLDAFRKK